MGLVALAALTQCTKAAPRASAGHPSSTHTLESASAATAPPQEIAAESLPLPAQRVVLESEMTLGTEQVFAKLSSLLAIRPGLELSGQAWELWALQQADAHARTGSEPARDLGAFSAPFYVARDATGNPERVRVPLMYDAIQRRLIETLVGAVRFPVGTNGTTWRARERDNLGWHVAEYRLAKGGSIERHKVSYERVARQLNWTVLSSTWHATRAADGTLQSLVGSESMTGKSDPLSVDFKLDLQLVASTERVLVSSGAARAIPPGYAEFDFGRSNQKSEREKDEFIARDLTIEYLLAALHASAATGPDWNHIYSSAAYLRLNPDALKTVETAVASQPELLSNGIVLVGETGSEGAQELLVRWLEQLRPSDPAKADAVLENVLRRVGAPGPALVGYLLRQASAPPSETQRGFVDAAALAIARAHDASDARATAWTAQLMTLCEAAPDATTRAQILASLGRIKAPEVLAFLLRYSHDPELLPRSGAIAGLGTHGATEGQKRLLELATTDELAQLRIAALRAMTFPGVKASADKLLAAYRADKRELVRVALVRTLARLVRTEPDIRAALRRAGSSETNERVRAELERAVQSS